MILAVRVLDRSTVEGPDELDASDCTFARPKATNFLSEDWIVADSKVPYLRELIELIKGLPVVDEIVFHREHVQVIEARLVVYGADSVFIESHSLEVRENAELDHFIP